MHNSAIDRGEALNKQGRRNAENGDRDTLQHVLAAMILSNRSSAASVPFHFAFTAKSDGLTGKGRCQAWVA